MAQKDLVKRKGYTLVGRRLTWTGRVVSEADWETLTDWEKHGPAGRIWCGATREWIKPPRKKK